MQNVTRGLLACLLALGLFGPARAETVQLKHKGLTLNAYLTKVDGNWPAGPVVLITHGTLAHGQMEITRTLQNLLRDYGVSSLAITLSLGQSDRQGMYDCNTDHTHRHTDAVTEIGMWKKWLRAQGVQKLALLGHSRGGNQTARFAATPAGKDVMATILIAPQTWKASRAAADYEQRYKTELQPLVDRARALVDTGKSGQLMKDVDFIYCEDARVSAASFLSYYAADPQMNTPDLFTAIPSPVRVYAGSEDRVVTGLIDQVDAQAGNERVSLMVIDGADHFFRDLYAEEIVEDLTGYLDALM